MKYYEVTYKVEKDGMEHTEKVLAKTRQEVIEDYKSQGFFKIRAKILKK